MVVSAVRSAQLLLLALIGCRAAEPPSQKPVEIVAKSPARPKKPPTVSIDKPHVFVPDNLAWLAFGGGSEPSSNQVSLAQDIALLNGTLSSPGLVLFASGPGAQVAVEQPAGEPPQRGDARSALSRLFGMPGAAHTRYEPTQIHVDGPATSEHVMRTLSQALTRGSTPLLVYVASHGERGESPAENSLGLWGGWSIKVRDVARLIDVIDTPRPSRFVVTACYGGGFANLLFVDGEPDQGVRRGDLCGLFAAPWDDEASGCDPNPDRRAQESYSIHFLHALTGRDRERRSRRAEIDIDRDGTINLLEAHTWARIHSKSFDVPTTTSERYLRYATPVLADGSLDPLSAPEDLHVVKVLGDELELHSEEEARTRLSDLTGMVDSQRDAVEHAQKAADDAFYALRIALLERWPLLDHPWDPRTLTLVEREESAMLELLEHSELAKAHLAAEERLQHALSTFDDARVVRARALRLVRAFETVRMASALKQHGGPEHARYQAIRRCERFAPKLRRERPAPRSSTGGDGPS